YDAHEFFTEMIEVKRRPWIHFAWSMLEKWLLPKFPRGYTVAKSISEEFKALYGINYAVVRNVPHYREPTSADLICSENVLKIMDSFKAQCPSPEPFILYQGAINEGRALIQLLDAMTMVQARLLLAGTGNLEQQVKEHIKKLGLGHKVYMCGNVPPDQLRELTLMCYGGITIFDAYSKNQYYSLGNKFFDYIMARKPQVCVNYPEYKAILKEFPVAVPIENTKPDSIATGLNNLLTDIVLYENLQYACHRAAGKLNWQEEEKTLLQCWADLLGNKK
ncbi:MAG TPA: glycosyltransferase, partial [Phnomibacter sp.]|nr:glycosyltransferase [Phnomibacter sp.]